MDEQRKRMNIQSAWLFNTPAKKNNNLDNKLRFSYPEGYGCRDYEERVL